MMSSFYNEEDDLSDDDTIADLSNNQNDMLDFIRMTKLEGRRYSVPGLMTEQLEIDSCLQQIRHEGICPSPYLKLLNSYKVIVTWWSNGSSHSCWVGGSRSRRIGKPTMSAPPGLSQHTDTLKVEDAERSSSKPTLKTRKISLSCLVSSVLSFERGRRRASRAREEELLQSAEAGDLLKVRRLVLQDGVVNINCTDPLGRTPLHLAVANEQKEIVNFLLGHVDKKGVYQALMLAINLGHDEIAEMIIEHRTYEDISNEIRQHGQAHFFLTTFGDDNQFSEEITPLILAAQQNRFEIVMALLMKNEVIQKPHKYQCACMDCDRMAKTDELKFAKARLNAYKGLSSEAYISLSSEDPVLTSFELRQELRQVAADEKYYTSEYSILGEQLSEYVVKLLDKVHGNEELNAILNASDSGLEDGISSTLPRLQLAIEYKEKKFVAHPSCQKKLTTMWYSDFNQLLKSRTIGYKFAFVTGITLLYPILAAWYIICPRTKFGDILRTPVVKFVAQAVSFVFFLGLILTHSYVEQKKLCATRFTDDSIIYRHYMTYRYRLNATTGYYYLSKMCIRNNTPSILEVLIMLWIAGLMWQECKQVYQSGFKTHFLDIYNHMDFFMLQFYIASITLRQLQHFLVYSAHEYFQHRDSWEKLVQQSDEALYNLYFLNADRYYWDAWDPYHMCEALFAVGNIINFTRLFYLLAISDHLGPMLISLERMLKDVMKFMTTFVPIFMAFMLGLYNMYWYYDPKVRGRVEARDHHIHTKAEDGFGSLELTFRTLVWSLFGLKDSKLVELQDKKIEGRGFATRLTESVGYIIFGVYHWGSVIVLLNMLIAMMTRSFEKIAIHQDVEWKFARSNLYMQYIEEGSTLPVPFNLIPSVKTSVRVLTSCIKCCDMSRMCKKSRTKEQLLMRMSVNSNATHNNKKNMDCESNNEGHCETTYVISNTAENINKERSRSPSPAPSPVFEPRTMNWGFTSSKAGDNDYKTVIKRVVRRYIFEHLQATVGGEGANEQQSVEAMKQEFHTIHNEINMLKPKVQTEFERVRAEMVDYRREVKGMQESIQVIHSQLKTITDLCRNSLQSGNSSTYSSDVESKPSEDIIMSPTVKTSYTHSSSLESLRQRKSINSDTSQEIVSFDLTVPQRDSNVNTYSAETETLPNYQNTTATTSTSQYSEHIPLERSPCHSTMPILPVDRSLDSNNCMFENLSADPECSARTFKRRKSTRIDPWNVGAATADSTPSKRKSNPSSSNEHVEEVDVYEYSL